MLKRRASVGAKPAFSGLANMESERGHGGVCIRNELRLLIIIIALVDDHGHRPGAQTNSMTLSCSSIGLPSASTQRASFALRT